MAVALFDENALAARLAGRSDLPSRLDEISRTISGRIVFTTSFGLEDQALTHAIFSAGRDIEVVTLDTGRLFPETHDVWAETEERYGRRIVAYAPEADDLANLVSAHGINGFRSSVAARQACCGVRKAAPLRQALAGAAAWITGLRAEQSRHRADVALAAFDETQRLIKFNPLADWTRGDVERFVADHRIPYNVLHDRGFPSIGCAPCTRAVRVGESERAGRWWWEADSKKECGLHLRTPVATTPTGLGGTLMTLAGAVSPKAGSRNPHPAGAARLTHLQRLEAESIHILREVVAESENPVLLYSIGKDSSVLLHLAEKAFYPARLPFPLLHVDTTWKFRDMITFRDGRVQELGLDLIVHVNEEGLKRGISPVTHGSEIHTDVMKTQALRQALDRHRFDAAIGGARRDEETSRAKERVFSLRNAHHRWDPKRQRPEPWRLYNTRKRRGESFRVFPLSNWTELDIWLYIEQEQIPIVPLYFAADRPVVRRDGMLIMRDDGRLPLRAGEQPEFRSVRFRTLGCYPLTGAVESTATTLPEIIRETVGATTSERQGRVIDQDGSSSMERKKQEGYF